MGKKFSIKEDVREIAFLFLLAAAYFLPVLMNRNGQVISAEGADVWNQYFYWRHFGFTSLARGEIPLWNPYIFSGTPYVAGTQSALFYPLNVLYFLFDTPFAINLSVTIHCFLASLFTYLFARYIDICRSGAVLAALSFTYGAAYFFHIYPGHLSNLCTMIWMPLIMMGLEALARTKQMRYAVWSGIALAVQFLAGHPQYFFLFHHRCFALFSSSCMPDRELGSDSIQFGRLWHIRRAWHFAINGPTPAWPGPGKIFRQRETDLRMDFCLFTSALAISSPYFCRISLAIWSGSHIGERITRGRCPYTWGLCRWRCA